MSTLNNRPATALLVIDVQNDVVAAAVRRDEVVATIAGLVDRAREHGTPVVWVQHSDPWLPIGSDPWRIVGELTPADGEPTIQKTYRDSFEATDLEDILAELGVGHLLVTGAQTDFCIRSTIHGGLARGYDVTLVSDAHTTEDLGTEGAPTPEQVIAHTNLYWAGQEAPGRTTAVVTASEVAF